MNTDLEKAYFLQNKISDWLKCIINLLYLISFLRLNHGPGIWDLEIIDYQVLCYWIRAQTNPDEVTLD